MPGASIFVYYSLLNKDDSMLKDIRRYLFCKTYYNLLEEDAQSAQPFLRGRSMLHTERLHSLITTINNPRYLLPVCYLFLFADMAGGRLIYRDLQRHIPLKLFTHYLVTQNITITDKERLRQCMEINLELSPAELDNAFEVLSLQYYHLLNYDIPADQLVLEDPVHATPETRGQVSSRLYHSFMRSPNGWHKKLEDSMVSCIQSTEKWAIHIRDKKDIISAINAVFRHHTDSSELSSVFTELQRQHIFPRQWVKPFVLGSLMIAAYTLSTMGYSKSLILPLAPIMVAMALSSVLTSKKHKRSWDEENRGVSHGLRCPVGY